MQMIPLTGSARPLPPGARLAGPAPDGQTLEVTLVLSPPASRQTAVQRLAAEQWTENRALLTRNDLEKTYGADPRALKTIESFAESNHLKIVRADLGRRSVILSGTSKNLSAAFGVKRMFYKSPKGNSYGHAGPVVLPVSLAGIVDGVLGLNDFPVQRISPPVAPVRRLAKAKKKTVSFQPFQMAGLYNFPAELNGQGECIALIELGGGFKEEDVDDYFQTLKLPAPKISVVSVDGAGNQPSPNSKGKDLEVQGDIETLGSVAPGAEIVVYFSPLTERGFYDAVVAAIHDEVHSPSIVSISFGEVELYWPPRTMQLLNDALQDAALLGITVCCAVGDSGSSGGVPGGKPHVFFPASSPHVLACGGTQLKTAGDKIIEEIVWSEGRHAATGGGVSKVFPRPSWQAKVMVPNSPNRKLRHGRGLPDVAANAADYLLIVDGQPKVIGGTSAVAPLWAGLIARINQKCGHPVGFLNPILYASYNQLRSLGAIREITKGTNGTYRARKGWNPCAGLGSPDGAKLAAHLAPAKTAKAAAASAKH
jgi:kumamolisin